MPRQPETSENRTQTTAVTGIANANPRQPVFTNQSPLPATKSGCQNIGHPGPKAGSPSRHL